MTSPLPTLYRTMYNFTVSAVEAYDFSRAAEVEVYIRVLDSNDHPPIFEDMPYNFSVVENAPKGTSVGTVRTSDADGTVNSQVYICSIRIFLYTHLTN